MRTTPRNDSTFEAFDFPPGLVGVYGSDVVFPNGQYAALHACSRDAHVVLQQEIDRLIPSVPLPTPSEALLRLAVAGYQKRLLDEIENAS